MKLIAISSSPRENSNSLDLLLDATNPLEIPVELYDLREASFCSCSCCGSCTGESCVHDDYITGLWEKIASPECIGLLLSTPVHFGLASELLIKFLYRGRFIRHRDFAAYAKPFGVIAVAGRRSGGAETTITSTWLPLIRQGMFPVGNGTETSQYGAMVWAGKKGEAMTDEYGVQQARDLAKNVEQIGKLMYHGKQHCTYTPPKFSHTAGTIGAPLNCLDNL